MAECQAGHMSPFLFATSLNCLSFNKSYILHTGTRALWHDVIQWRYVIKLSGTVSSSLTISCDNRTYQ